MWSYVARNLAVAFAAFAAAKYKDDRERKRDTLNDRIKRESKKWRKYHNRFQSLMSSNETRMMSDHASDSRCSQMPMFPEAGTQLQVTNDQDEVVLAIHQIAEPEPREWQRVHDRDHPVSRLNPLLSVVPSATIAGHVATNAYYVVECNGPLMKTADGFAYRAMSRGPAGIQEHATLFKANQLATLAGGAALWHLASVAFAQKHLHDISAALKKIESAIGQVADFQQDERKSRIRGTARQFALTLDEDASGEIRRESLYMIENALRELLEVEEHLKIDLDRTLGKLKDASDIDSSTLEVIARASDLLEQAHFCVAVRMCGCQILAIASEERSDFSHHARDIQDSHAKLFQNNVCSVYASIERLLSRDKASFWDDLSRVKSSLHSIHKSISPATLEDALKSFQESQIMMRALAQKRNAPERLLVRAEEGKVVAFSVIDDLIEA